MLQSSSWWGAALVLVGITLISGGLLLGGTWADVYIEVGAAAGVGGIVVLFKPRLMRQVDQVATEAAATTAEAIATSKTVELERRFEKFESITDIQAKVLERLDEEVEQMVAAMMTPSYSDLESLLKTAADRGFFSGRLLIRTGDVRESPLIEIFYDQMEPEPFSTNFPRIILKIHTLRWLDGYGLEFLETPGGDVVLESKDTLEDITEKIVLAYNRIGSPIAQNTIAYLFEHLTSSFRLMAGARQDSTERKSRILGKLFFMINEEWVLTDRGLESTLLDRIFGPEYDDYEQPYGINIANVPCPLECNADLWDETQWYVLRLDEEISNRI